MKQCLLFLVFAGQLTIAAADPDPLSTPVKYWIGSQAEIHTWTADLTETRTLQSLTQPLVSPGRIWFQAPDLFRWELGKPPETIAISTGTNLFIIYPRLERVEKIALTPGHDGQWRSALDMLEAGFPRSETQLRDRYNILSQTGTNELCQLELQPSSPAIQQMVPRIQIDIAVTNYSLAGTELQFSDGSTMRNDFSNIVVDPKLPRNIFTPDIPTNYTVVEPMEKTQ